MTTNNAITCWALYNQLLTFSPTPIMGYKRVRETSRFPPSPSFPLFPACFISFFEFPFFFW
jgi:hypothetical protein